MVSCTTSLLDSLHTTKAVASYRRQRRYCASALSRNFAVEGGHNASKRDELAPLRSIVSSRQRAVNRFANSRVVMSARRTPPSRATCWRGQFNIRWVVLMEVRPLRWVLEGLREAHVGRNRRHRRAPPTLALVECRARFLWPSRAPPTAIG